MKERIVTRPTKTNEISFDELYEEISRDWRRKAADLQARRWRVFKLKTDGGGQKKRFMLAGSEKR